VGMLMQQRYALALLTAVLHLMGSLLLTVAGIKSASLFLLP
jgi:CrcB protein